MQLRQHPHTQHIQNASGWQSGLGGTSTVIQQRSWFTNHAEWTEADGDAARAGECSGDHRRDDEDRATTVAGGRVRSFLDLWPYVPQEDEVVEQLRAYKWLTGVFRASLSPFDLGLLICAPIAEPGCCGETQAFCCHDVKVNTIPLPTLPEGWEQVFQAPVFSRQYNNVDLFAFCITAMGVSGDKGFVHQPAPRCVKILGRTYHCVLPAEMRGPSHWVQGTCHQHVNLPWSQNILHKLPMMTPHRV